MTHLRSVFVSSAVGADVLAAVAFSVDQNLATVVGVLVATILVVVAVIGWVDNRIRQAITAHEEIDVLRHDVIVDKIEALRTIIVGNIKATSEYHQNKGG